jgi:aryl-alcohol dehydrogenase-like predicted oxidoreductase
MRLSLGTAQFGSAYGIANSSGQIPYAEAEQILAYARRSGIDVLDTAIVYGESETVLGRIGMQGWKLITKLPPLDEEVTDVESWMFQHVDAALSRLRIDGLYGLLLHRPEDMLGRNGAAYRRALEGLRETGRVRLLGYSIYSPEMLEELTAQFWPDIVQTPYNVFDQRIRTSGWLERLTKGGCRVHARSVFLQGLLVMEATRRPAYFQKWKIPLGRWKMLVESAQASPLQVAVNFALQQEGLERVVVGIDSLSQLTELVAAAQKIAIPDLAELASEDPRLIEPFRWEMK